MNSKLMTFGANEPFSFILLRDFQQVANQIFGIGKYSVVETIDLSKRYDSLFEFSDLRKQSLIGSYPILGCESLRETVIYHKKDNNIEYLAYEFGDDDYHQQVKLLAAPKGQLWKLLHWANSQNKKSLVKPILDEKAYQDTIGSTLRFLKHRKKIKKMGVIANKGILIHGEPGNGKTLITSYIKTLAENMGLTVNIVTEKKIREGHFYGDIVILDDFSIEPLTTRNDISDLLLSQMDGPSKEGGRVYIITTNEVNKSEKLLSALMRPGRIDSIVELKKPDENLRKKYIESWQVKLDDKTIERILEKTKDFSFAQLNYIQTEIVMMKIEGIPLDIDKVFSVTSGKLGDNVKPLGHSKRVGFFGDED